MVDGPPNGSSAPPAPAAPTPSSANSPSNDGNASSVHHAGTSSSSASSAIEASPKRDVVLVGGPTADGGGVHVLRARDERIELGELRAVEEGRPIHGELVTLAPRKDSPRLYDVKESVTIPSNSSSAIAPRKGPARVATDAYRKGWDDVFGAKPDRNLN